MSKVSFISGSILEFKVPANLGYAYCKILDFRYIREFDGVLIKVFDYIAKKPIADINILREKDWLFGCRRMPWLPGTRGKGAWKLKGVLIAEEDNVIPHFKYCIKSSPFTEDKLNAEVWDVVKNINEYIPCPYECVRHLEDTVVSPQLSIEIRTAMECFRINGVPIEKHFDLTKTVNNLVFKQMINVPIYRTIPKEIRGKGIC